MFRTFLLSLLIASQAWAGLPPTTTKGSGDSTPVTTFEFDFPNIPITHTGTKGSVGTVSVAGGGTGDTTLTAHGVLLGNGTSAVNATAVGASNTVLHGNTSADPTYSAVSLTADVTGTLPVGSGGTGDTTLTSHGVLLGAGTSAVGATAVGATNTVLHGNTGADPTYSAVSLTADVTGTLPIANGGSGQTTANAALNAFLPSQTGNSGKFLTTDGSNTSWATTSGSTSPTGSEEIYNLGLTGTVASNALTIAMKQSDGSTDPASGSGAVKVGFRNSTSTTGGYNERSVTAALSVVVPSGASLGHTSGANEFVYVYAQDNSGTVQMCVSGSGYFDEGVVQTTVTISGSSTARTTLYCTTGATGGIRFIGREKVNESTAGTWASAPTEVSLFPNSLNKLTVAGTNTEVVTRAQLTIATSTCTINSQIGNWISSCSSSSSVATLTLTSGFFSGSPMCTCTSQGSNDTHCRFAGAMPTSSSIGVVLPNNSNVAQNEAFDIICVGPR